MTILVKASDVDLFLEDGNTVVIPSGSGMVHDTAGEHLDKCSLFFGPIDASRERVDELPSDARDYFGNDYCAHWARIDVPRKGWKLVGNVREIVYYRPGRFADDWRHPFDPPQPLYRSRDWWCLMLPDDCRVTWRGIERP